MTTLHQAGGAGVIAALPVLLRPGNAIFAVGLALLWLTASAMRSFAEAQMAAHAGPFKAACVALSILVFLVASLRATRQTRNVLAGTLTAAWVSVMATSIVWGVGLCASFAVPGATHAAVSGIWLLFPSVAIVPGVAAVSGGAIACVSFEGVDRTR